jgi:hypothetical protein
VQNQPLSVEINKKRLKVHIEEARLNFFLEIFGDHIAERENYLDINGLEALHFYLVHKFNWLPKIVKAISLEEVRFVLHEEMKIWEVPDDACFSHEECARIMDNLLKEDEPHMIDINESRIANHLCSAYSNYHLELFGDHIAASHKYKVNGTKALHLYLLKRFNWMPEKVESMTPEQIRFVLQDEMAEWTVPQSAQFSYKDLYCQYNFKG